MSTSSPNSARVPCPCGRRDRRELPLPYAQCCGRYLDDFERTPATDAESLMRSRYTAFVLERADYLLATWHVSTRPATLGFEPGVKWLGLEVRSRSVLDADHAEVEFVARQRSSAGVATRLHERSRFVREDDGAVSRWYYLDGDLR
ncbi:YchJ family metal-binding protein [Variovorax sp. LjRoot290]|uniref:YchJ family protein n=1 Tax=unclassified Variovorax TaxID=663243 RepID=UPI003ECCA573